MNGGSAGTARRFALAAAGLWAATLAVFWPGYALYDSVAQYGQALSGVFDDWHPPIMARLWMAFDRAVGGGAGPMLAAQLGGWWLGLGLIAAALARRGRTRAGAAVLAVGVLPPLLGWQVAVLKDAQLAGALMAATGLVAWWRLRERRVPWPARAMVAALLIYAALVRANGVFAVAPLVAALGADRRVARCLALGAALVVGALAGAGPINHDLLGAARSGVERTQPTYDLVGIAVRTRGATPIGLTGAERDAVVAKHCASPYFWDPLGDDTRCGGDLARLRTAPPSALYRDLARAALARPLAYALHRLAHLNSTERWLVPVGWPGATPPAANEPNRLGLVDPGSVGTAWQRYAGWIVETPLGWPICWVIVAMAALVTAWRRPSGPASVAAALALSALTMEASFAVVSIASDLRYHLWPMAASAVAAVLVLAEGGPSARVRRSLAALLALVIVGGGIARAVLPTPPQSYAGMLVWGAAD